VPTTYNANDIQEFLDREAIRDVLHRYAHGIDRCDAVLMQTCYWPESVDEQGEFKGPSSEFIKMVVPHLRKVMSTSQHMMINMLIRIKGNAANVETYFQAYDRWGQYDEKGARDFIIGGRYLDTMEKRGKEWRIIKRVVIFDYFRDFEDTGNWKASKTVNEHRTLGARSPDDAASKLFGGSRLRIPLV